VTRISWERLAALAGVAFVVLYAAAFGLGIEVGASDREILDHYADSGNRAKEAVAFFLIAAAALAFVVFAGSLRSLIARVEQESANTLNGRSSVQRWVAILAGLLYFAGQARGLASEQRTPEDGALMEPRGRNRRQSPANRQAAETAETSQSVATGCHRSP
jgi:hypothetical protein